eukprot:5929938-Prymnesium_polylepis.2
MRRTAELCTSLAATLALTILRSCGRGRHQPHRLDRIGWEEEGRLELGRSLQALVEDAQRRAAHHEAHLDLLSADVTLTEALVEAQQHVFHLDLYGAAHPHDVPVAHKVDFQQIALEHRWPLLGESFDVQSEQPSPSRRELRSTLLNEVEGGEIVVQLELFAP